MSSTSSFPRFLPLPFSWGREYVHFCMASTPRNGTNLLRHSLNAHPHIVMYGELFNPNRPIREYEVGWTDLPHPVYDNEPVGEYLRTYTFPRVKTHYQAIGFKLFPFQLQWLPDHERAWKDILSIPRMKVLHVKRRNALDVAISNLIALRDKKWLHQGTDEPAFEKLSTTFEELAKKMHGYHVGHERLAYRFRNHDLLQVHYEDVLADFDTVLGGIQRWLGVEERILRPKLKMRKQRMRSRREAVENYDALREACAKERPEWLHFFDEPEQLVEIPTSGFIPATA